MLAKHIKNEDDLELEDELEEELLEDDETVDGKGVSTVDLSADSVDLWLSHIGRFPLIDAETEIALAKLIEQKDPVASEMLVNSNYRLVIPVARQFCGRGVPFSDLIQEGNIGLIRAVGKFDYRFGCKFSTYAVNWIRSKIRRAIPQQRDGHRVPNHFYDLTGKSIKIIADFYETNQRDPTSDELSFLMDVTLEVATSILTAIYQGHDVSLSSSISSIDDSSEISDVISDKNAPDPEQLVFNNTLKMEINEALKILSPRERYIIRARYGLNNQPTMTLVELSMKFKIERERVRQLEFKALRKLRNPCRSRKLYETLGYSETFMKTEDYC